MAGLFDRIRYLFTGKMSAMGDRATTRMQARVDNAQTSDENKRHWANTDQLSADYAFDPATRFRLRNRARYETLNNCYAKGIVRSASADLIGTGPRLQLSIPGDEGGEIAKEIERSFAVWADETHFALKLRVAEKSRVRDGEAFGIFDTNERLQHPVKFDTRWVEAEVCTSPYAQPTNPRLIDGILFDRFGLPVEYYFLVNHPGNLIMTGLEPLASYTVPAARVVHWYSMDRFGQHRAIPEITPALGLYGQLRRYTMASLTAAEFAAMLAGVMKTNTGVGDAGVTTIEDWTPFEMVRGALLTLPDGWEATQFKSENPPTGYGEFKRELLNESGRATGQPLNIVTGNSSGYNFSSGRLDHLPYQRTINIDRNDLRMIVLDPVFREWWNEAALIGLLPPATPPLVDCRWSWNWDGFDSIDQNKDAMADDTRLKNGTTTLAEVYAAYGQSWEEQLDQLARERDYATKLGLPWPITPGGGSGGTPGIASRPTGDQGGFPAPDSRLTADNLPDAVAAALVEAGIKDAAAEEVMEQLAPAFAALKAGASTGATFPMKADAQFEEDKHPRDRDGKFGSGGGGGGSDKGSGGGKSDKPAPAPAPAPKPPPETKTLGEKDAGGKAANAAEKGPDHPETQKTTQTITSKFAESLDKIKNAPGAVAKVKEGLAASKDAYNGLKDKLVERYGIKGAGLIIASGQGIAWAGHAAAWAAGVPLYIPGSGILGMIPAVAIAEGVRAMRSRKTPAAAMLYMAATKELTPAEIEKAAKQFVGDMNAAHTGWIKANHAELTKAFKGQKDDDKSDKPAKSSLPLLAGNWSEEDHPRDKDGKFGDGAGGGDSKPAEKDNPKDKGEASRKDTGSDKAPTYDPTPSYEKARVGVPAMETPPPPDIGRLPNLSDDQRKVESRFADKFEANPDKFVGKYRDALASGKVGVAPNVYATDDVKALNKDWNPSKVRAGEELTKDSKQAMAKYNTAVHQTANAIAKRAFVEKLDEMAKLKDGDPLKSVLVTNGGCAAGKGSTLARASDPKSPYAGVIQAADKHGAVWDAAGEQNATENAWIKRECDARGIKTTYAYVWADPMKTWDADDRGVVRRAMRKGRMVDARLFADSYAEGAKNMNEFVQKNPKENFIFIDNREKGSPKLLSEFPKETLQWDGEKIYKFALDNLKSHKDDLPKSLYKAGRNGTKIWGPPAVG